MQIVTSKVRRRLEIEIRREVKARRRALLAPFASETLDIDPDAPEIGALVFSGQIEIAAAEQGAVQKAPKPRRLRVNLARQPSAPLSPASHKESHDA